MYMYICICLCKIKSNWNCTTFCLSNQIFRTKVNLKCFSVLSPLPSSSCYPSLHSARHRESGQCTGFASFPATVRRRYSIPAFAAGAIKQIVQFLLCRHLPGRSVSRPTPKGVERFEVFAAKFALVLLLRACRLSLHGHLCVQVVQIANVLCGGKSAHTYTHTHIPSKAHISTAVILAKKEVIGNRCSSFESLCCCCC